MHTNLEAALMVAQRITAAIGNQEMLVRDSEPINVTVSIGVKSLENELSLEELINKADDKLYEAKKKGKNQVEG